MNIILNKKEEESPFKKTLPLQITKVRFGNKNNFKQKGVLQIIYKKNNPIKQTFWFQITKAKFDYFKQERRRVPVPNKNSLQRHESRLKNGDTIDKIRLGGDPSKSIILLVVMVIVMVILTMVISLVVSWLVVMNDGGSVWCSVFYRNTMSPTITPITRTLSII